MLEIGVHKHISYQLCRIEVGGKEKVQTQHVVQIYPVSLCHHIAEETQYVDYQQILVTVGILFISLQIFM